MKTHLRACFLLFAAVFAAVPRPSDAFRSPAKDMQTMTVNFDEIDSANYSGPVFVIKEVSDDDGGRAYEAFVLAGGIEEVQRPMSSTRTATRASGAAKKPSAAAAVNNGTAAPTPGDNKKKKPATAAAVNNGTAAPTPGDNKKKKPATAAAAAAINNGTAAPTPGDGKKKKPSAAAAVNNGTAVADGKKPSTAAAAVNNGTAAEREKPSATVENGPEVKEDPDFFGVLIDHDSAAHIKLPGSVRVNVSLSVLLRVASSRMPWLLVLRRNSTVRLSVYRETTATPVAETSRGRHRRAVDRGGATAALQADEGLSATGAADDGNRGNGYDAGGNPRLGSRSLPQPRRYVGNASRPRPRPLGFSRFVRDV